VVIEHEDGVRSYYAHLKSRTVSVGQRVSGGQTIGYSGNTGRVNPPVTASNPYAGTHLHFEIRVKRNGAYVKVDPTKYIDFS
jgi:murein DD-endopeptidase MepM/ murein hydrolase activator NlpD